MNPNEARLHEVLSDLFPEEDDVVERITDNMVKEGYDRSQPIVLGHWGDDWYLVDGHMRVKAAIQAGITDIPADEQRFRDFDEALAYAISRQRDRRNLTSDVLWKHIEAAGNMPPHGGDRRSKDFKEPYGHLKPKTLAEVADIAGTSKATVRRQRTIEQHGDDDIKEAVKTGKMSHTAGYEETQRRRRERGDFKCSVERLKNPNDSKESSKPFKEAITQPQDVTEETVWSEADKYAGIAIENLRKIMPNDPHREEALQRVQKWLDENRRKQ